MKVTRIAYSKNLNKDKFNRLEEQAKQLGRVRTEVWQRFGSIRGVGVKDRAIRDQWIKQKRDFAVLATPWKETLRDAIADIAMTIEAAKVPVRRAIGKHTKDTNEQRRLFTSFANNLGRKKLNTRVDKTHKNIRTVVFNAVHRVVDKACHIACEDLTTPMAGGKFGKNVNRRLASWTKGIIAEALENVSQRRGSTLHYVNPAYTSQMDSKTCLLLGKRVGDKFYRENGEVMQADANAARNVLARLYDPEIDRWMPYQKVKSLLLKWTESQRLRLPNQDSSCKPCGLSTESESPNFLGVQICPSF